MGGKKTLCFQALCPQLLESGEAPPHCDPGANVDGASFSLLQSNRKVLSQFGNQSTAGNDEPES